ncbi:hypothetical protein LTR53_011393 [Teratosphaeriaceae sp. CCFEE 6253]|nr:hypothetical protein LTR53_011393 [Teratosphaeriaceae sp. CCFEE 6253]
MKITAMPILSHLKRERQTDKGKAPVNAVSVPQEAHEQTQMPSAEARISAVRGMDLLRAPQTGEPGPSSWHGRPLSLEMVRTVPCVTFEVTARCEAFRIAELPVAAVDTPGMPAALSNDAENERSRSHDCLALEAVESPDAVNGDAASVTTASDTEETSPIDGLLSRSRSFAQQIRERFNHAPASRRASSLGKDSRPDSKLPSSTSGRRTSSVLFSASRIGYTRASSSESVLERSPIARAASCEKYVKRTTRPGVLDGWGDRRADGHGAEVELWPDV